MTRSDGLLRYPDGHALKFDVVVRIGDSPDMEAILNSIAADLRAVGVLLEVRALSPERFEGVWLTDHAFDLIAFTYSQYPGFTDFDLYGSEWDVRTNIQGFNPGGYHNDKVDRAISPRPGRRQRRDVSLRPPRNSAAGQRRGSLRAVAWIAARCGARSSQYFRATSPTRSGKDGKPVAFGETDRTQGISQRQNLAYHERTRAR